MARAVEKERLPGISWTIEGLGAKGPCPKLKEKMALFGQFVGDWDIVENRYLTKDGTWAKSKGELHWGWILGGKAVQDVWMSIDEKTGKAIPWGTTVRLYDPRIDAWHSVWVSSRQGVVRTFVGRKVGDEIVLEEDNTKRHPEKWIFSEIVPDSFKWRAEVSHDGGKTFAVEEVMRIRRRKGPKSRVS